MLDSLRAARRCFVYVPVRLRRRELLSMASAAGFELQADSEALWITVDSESRDISLAPGEQFRIRTQGRVLISADSAVTVMVSGEADRVTSFAVIRTNGEREDIYPPAALACDVAPIRVRGFKCGASTLVRTSSNGGWSPLCAAVRVG